MSNYNRKACYNLSCLLQAYCHLSTNGKLLPDSFGETYGVKNGSDRMRNSGDHDLEFATLSVSGLFHFVLGSRSYHLVTPCRRQSLPVTACRVLTHPVTPLTIVMLVVVAAAVVG